MSADPVESRSVTWLRPVGEAHPKLAQQQAFVALRDRLLIRAGVTGQRLIATLYVVLNQHEPTSVVDLDGSVHLTCAECRPGVRPVGEQYPCPTAQQAAWALDAVLR